MRRLSASTVLGLLAILAVPASSSQVDALCAHGDVRLNYVQVIGTHNSYHREISEREQAADEAATTRASLRLS